MKYVILFLGGCILFLQKGNAAAVVTPLTDRQEAFLMRVRAKEFQRFPKNTLIRKQCISLLIRGIPKWETIPPGELKEVILAYATCVERELNRFFHPYPIHQSLQQAALLVALTSGILGSKCGYNRLYPLVHFLRRIFDRMNGLTDDPRKPTGFYPDRETTIAWALREG